MYASKYVNNKDVRIHYYDSLEKSDEKLTPLIVCPGLSETAEEYLDLLEAVFPRRCILLSFRGRGGSDTPESGYNLEEHVSDIESVVRDSGIESFHLFGYSRGVAYALGYARKYKEQIKSLILGDYPPEHRAMPKDWPDDYINNYLIPDNRAHLIRPAAVMGIQRESTPINLESFLPMDVLLARGKLEDSLVSDSDLNRYQNICVNLSIKEYPHSGHALKGVDRLSFYNDIVHFLDRV